ncbi:MAG TPA: hypothetical protein VMP00_00095 [Burkholderiales bacterium]|nr:hypothetical protein [Burkholderiales bacterium]
MRPPVAMLLMLGIILGPLYYAYGVYASGNIAETFSMADRGKRWTAPDGTILRFRGGLGFRPQPLNLTPDMNEVKLRLRFAIPKEAVGNLGDMRYQATLLEYDHTILERSFVLKFGRSGKATADVGPLEISYPGAYLFLLEEVGAAPISPEITLEVIQEVRRPLMPLVWGGLGLLVLALLLALYDLVSAVRKQRPFQ